MFSYDFVQVMTNTRDNARMEGDGSESKEAPPQGNQVPLQVPNAPQVENVTLKEFRTSMNLLAQASTLNPIGRWWITL